MNVLGISGTPRVNGNSSILVDYALIPFKHDVWNVKHLKMSTLTVQPCKACEKCMDSNKCIIEDDMHFFYEAFDWCDAIIVGSPVYSRNICSQLMAVLDRHYAVRKKRPLEGKVGGAIAVGRGTGGGNAIVINAIYNWMLSCGIICVPGELNGVTAIASEPGDILKQVNQELDAFVYIASHDLREPLRTIESFISVIQEDLEVTKLNSKQNDCLSRIVNATQRMRNLIEDLTNLARATRGKSPNKNR